MAQHAPLDVPLVQSADSASSGASPRGSVRELRAPRQGGLVQRLFLTWVFPLVQRAAHTEKLEASDLFELEASGDPAALADELREHWRVEQERLRQRGGQGGRKGWTLLRVLFRIHLPRVRLFWSARFIQAFMGFAPAIFLQQIVQFVEDEDAPLWHGLLFVFGLFTIEAANVLMNGVVLIGLQAMSYRVMASVTACIFRKVLLLRSDAMAGFSTGRLNNLITTDVETARSVVRRIHVILFVAPIRLVVSVIYLYQLVGMSAFAGMGWLVIIAVLNPPIMYMQNKLEEKQQELTDQRVFKVTETLQAIHTIKCYAWEEPATKMIESARRAEIRSMFKLYILYIITEAMWQSVLPVTALVIFFTYSVFNPETPLRASTAFTLITVLDLLNSAIFDIPWVMTSIIQGLVAARRIEALLVLPENAQALTWASFTVDEESATEEVAQEAVEESKMRSGAIQFANVSFQWLPAIQTDQGEEQEAEENAPDENTTAFKLDSINLSIRAGSLVALVGPTASGKTSFLRAILGEMPLASSAGGEECKEEQGRLHINRGHGIAFAPQQPWVFNASIRENILFGEPYNTVRYDECVRCCNLVKDLALLKSGDQTRVGEKGTSLSGGQKARVCLARAAYKLDSSHIFLLDDPYSALDAHVAASVHEDVVLKLLAKRTRIVATNRLEFLTNCDLVIVLDGGRVEAAGKLEDVQRSSSTLRRLLLAQGLLEADSVEEPLDQPTDSPEVDLTRGISGHSAKSTELKRTLSASPSHGSPGNQTLPDDKTEEEQSGVDGQEEEEYEVGNLKKEVLLFYIRHMGSVPVLCALSLVYGLSEILTLLSAWWLSVWTDKQPVGNDMFYYLYIYTGLNVMVTCFLCVQHLLSNMLSFRAALRLHANMLAALLRRPMSFFQDTPHGRIINRFSKDTEEIDKELIWSLVFCIVPMIQLIGTLLLIALQAWQALLAFAPMLYFFYKVWKYYNRAALDVKRISKVVASPVYDHFSNLCRENGVSVVRAHNQGPRQFDLNATLIVDQQRPKYSMTYLEQWFTMRMSHLGQVLVLFCGLFVVLARNKLIRASRAGLVLSMAATAADMLQGVLDQISEFGMAFNCVERVKEYSSTSPSLMEAASTTDVRPPDAWPSAGNLAIENLKLRYKPDLPYVLKGIDVSIPGGQRLGIIGRTGAGKSSLLLALFRIVEPEAGTRITLDGLDVLAMGLFDLRRRLATIPQEPVLFTADMKYNCDPFGEHSVADIWSALEDAQLAPWVKEQWRQRQSGEATELTEEAKEEALKLDIKEGGQNLSAGQRQMVAIARAVLRRSKLVVLDEATAAIDASTDAAIQEAIRRCFSEATTLTIAHRIKTILDSDRIMSLADGQVVELDAPTKLLENPAGLFAQLVAETEASSS
mmetsp:Transcript_22255/g.50826  ORF Transcript_22255/g.50826 Transcript_22255/m.50826 type:complete len:1391 (+) Transcript_22255:30-4202(+)